MAEQKALVTKLRDTVDRQRNRLAKIGEALDEASPVNTAIFDIGGAVVGIAAAWGIDAGVRKLAGEKNAEPTWKTSLSKLGIGTGAYALSLAVPYDRPMSPMRRGISSAALVTMALGVDATARKARKALAEGQERKARAQLDAVAAAERARIQAELAAKK